MQPISSEMDPALPQSGMPRAAARQLERGDRRLLRRKAAALVHAVAREGERSGGRGPRPAQGRRAAAACIVEAGRGSGVERHGRASSPLVGCHDEAGRGVGRPVAVEHATRCPAGRGRATGPACGSGRAAVTVSVTVTSRLVCAGQGDRGRRDREVGARQGVDVLDREGVRLAARAVVLDTDLLGPA